MSETLQSPKSRISAPAAAYAAGSPREPRVRRLLLSLAIVFGLVAFVVAFGGVARDLDYAATIHSLRRLPASALALSVLMTAVSFAGLIGREATALRYVGARPPRLAVLVGGLASAALGNVAGFVLMGRITDKPNRTPQAVFSVQIFLFPLDVIGDQFGRHTQDSPGAPIILLQADYMNIWKVPLEF